LESIRKRRGLIREGRRNNEIPTAALVGYTNVGKSTLLNRLCNSDVFAENKLFATLDPTARKLELKDGRDIMLIDTVGFIRKLPHDLVDAFKSTLEEAVFADILLHVVDISSEESEVQIQVVNDILSGLGVSNKPILMVLNKIDQAGEDFRVPLSISNENLVEVSALTGYGIEELAGSISELIPTNEIEVELLVPYNEGWAAPYVYDNGKVSLSEYTEGGTLIKAVLEKSKVERIRKFMVVNDTRNIEDIN
jgi:GTP-binding protein HflX